MAFNLFDFGSPEPSDIERLQAGQFFGGEQVPVKSFADLARPTTTAIERPLGASPFAGYRSQSPARVAQQITKSSQTVVPNGTVDTDKDMKFLKDLKNQGYSAEDAFQILSQIKQPSQEKEPQDFLSGLGEKTKSSFFGGIERIRESGEGLASGSYTAPEAFIRGGAGAIQSIFSPIAGAVGQTVQSGIESIPLDFKEYIYTKTNPTVEDIKTWYKSQSPEQKRNLQNIGVGVELLANFAGVKLTQGAAKKIGGAGMDFAKKTAHTVEKVPGIIKKGVSAIDEGVEAGVERLAGKVLGSSDGSKELFKATSPSYNTLSKSKDIKNMVGKSKVADETVVEYGHMPKNTTERVTAYKDSMKSIWDDITRARGGVSTKFDSNRLADTIDSEIDKLSVGGVINPAIKSDIDALRKQSDYFRRIGKIDIPTLGNQRTLINAITDWGATTEYGNTFSNIMKKVASEIKENEDAIIGGAKGSKISDKLRQYGALRSMYDDVVKQDIKALRAKGMGIEESFSRISGIPEILGGVAQIVFNPKQAVPTILSGGSKVLLGKVAGKLKDPNYLIRTGYEKLSKSIKPVKISKKIQNIKK